MLRAERVQAGVTVRRLANDFARAHSTISDFENGRRLAGVEVVEQYEDYFGLARGTLGAQRERARAERLESPRDATVDENLGDVVCPYLGLRAFEVDDAALFFGRESQVRDVLARLDEERFIAVLGASGSGKSSFVHAGLIARITGARPTAGRVAHVLLTPGEHPFQALTTALSALGRRVPGVPSERAEAAPGVLHRRTPPVQGLPVIVVDQLEELFTLCADEGERRHFVDALIAVWREPSSRVIVALRADFYGRVAAYSELASAVVANQALIGPMSKTDLRRAIELPAAAAGVLLQPGLADTMIDDLADEPGALPLLSHALLETWKRRRRLMLTLAGYREAGGVRGAIAQTAERTLLSLPTADQAIARSIFLSLSDVGADAEPTRRRIARAELASHVPSDEVERVLGVLVDARLVTIDEDTVTVAHETLIRHWPRLRGWFDAVLAGLIIHRRLTAAAREWDNLDREPAALYRGARLATAREWAIDSSEHIRQLERDFLAASQSAEESEAADKARRSAQLEALLEAARHRTQRLRALAGGLAVLIAVVAALAVWAIRQRDDAQRQTRQATSLALAASSVPPLTTRPDISLALAFEAYRDSPRPEARAAVIQALLAARRSRMRGVIEPNAAPQDVISVPDKTLGFSFDGRTLATAGFGNTVELWDSATRSRLGRLSGHAGAVTAVSFSRDNKTLASASLDNTVRLWDLTTREQRGHFSGHTGAVKDVAFSPNGKSLASASIDKTIRLWDPTSGKLRGRLKGKTPILAVAFSPDGRTLASGSRENAVRLWNPATGKQLRQLRGHAGAVKDVAYSPDGKTLASANNDKTIRLWDAATGRLQGALSGHAGGVDTVAFSPDGEMLASAGGRDGTARLWDPVTRKPRGRLRGHTESVTGVAFSRDGKTLATAALDDTVRLWDPRTRTLKERSSGHKPWVSDIAFSPDGKTLVTGGMDTSVRLWDPVTLKQLAQLTGHIRPYTAYPGTHVAFTPDRKMLATSAGATVRLWDPATRKQLGRLNTHDGVVSDIEFSPNSKTLATAGPANSVRFWEPVTRKQIGRLSDTPPVTKVEFSPDGKMLATASVDRTVRLWDAATHKQIGRLSGEADGVNEIEFSPDGKMLATASVDRTVQLWDPATRKQLGQLSGHTGAVNDVEFSPDGKTVATGSFDNTVRLWDPVTRKQLAQFGGGTGAHLGVSAVAFSPDGRTLASGGPGDRVHVWGQVLWRTVAELRATVCDILLTRLSRAEWDQYSGGITYRRSCP